MTGWRFVFSSFIALFIAGVGVMLFFEPAPAEHLRNVAAASDALLASSAAAGAGIWLPQLAVIVPASDSGSVNASVLVALATMAPSTQAHAAIQPTATNILATATLKPVKPATPLASNTPRPTATRAPSSTPAPTRVSQPTRVPPPATGLTLNAAISGCGDITKAGGYFLTQSIGSTQSIRSGTACINIRASGVTLDCKGLDLTGTGFGGSGINVRKTGFLGTDRPSNVEIRNCNISAFHFGIYVEGSQNLYLHDNNASGNFDDVNGQRYGIFLGMTEGGGIRLNDSLGARVENNTTTNEAIGIDVRSSNGVHIRGNQSSNNSAWGVNIYSTSNSEVSGNTTVNNVRYCTWGAGVVGPGCDAGGIVLQNGSNGNTIANNQVTGENGNGIFIKAHAIPCGSNNIISGNTITNSRYNSIELGFCSGNQIVGNVITGGTDGIWMGFSTNTTIRNNTIQNQSNHGIISSNSHDNTITNNNLINDREGIYLYWQQYNPNEFSWIDLNQYRTVNNCICSNIFTNNVEAAIHIQNITGNQIVNNTWNKNGRNIVSQGDTDGNNISGNHDAWLPGLPDLLLTFATRQ